MKAKTEYSVDILDTGEERIILWKKIASSSSIRSQTNRKRWTRATICRRLVFPFLSHTSSLSLSIIITGGVRSDDSAGSRAVRFTTVREFRQFTINDSLEKREEEREWNEFPGSREEGN